MSSISLTVGAGYIDRIIPNADVYLLEYRKDTGYLYQNYQPITDPDKVIPEDLAVTLLMNSQVGWRAFQTLYEQGHTIDLSHLPKKTLENTSREERRQVATLIAKMAQLPGFASSVATKVLHKKRPSLIPVLDNQAIYGAYMNPDWPQKLARTNSIKDQNTICNALDWIAFDLNRPENAAAWISLQPLEPPILAFNSLTVFGGCIFERFNPLYDGKMVIGLKKDLLEREQITTKPYDPMKSKYIINNSEQFSLESK